MTNWREWLLTQEAVVEIYRQSGARLGGHFVFSSWLHASKYLKREILTAPGNEQHYMRLCQALAAKIIALIESGVAIDFLTGPAKGGVVLARSVQSLLRLLGYELELIETVKVGEKMFELELDADVTGRHGIMLEDVVTTGDSCRGAMKPFVKNGATIVAIYSFLSIFDQTAEIMGVQCFEALLDERLETYDVPKHGDRVCPMCVEGVLINTDEGVGRGAEYVAKYGQPKKLPYGIAHMT